MITVQIPMEKTTPYYFEIFGWCRKNLNEDWMFRGNNPSNGARWSEFAFISEVDAVNFKLRWG